LHAFNAKSIRKHKIGKMSTWWAANIWDIALKIELGSVLIH